ncbi:putative F-box protein At3g22650 [Cicer arietinum]|uniref:Uncharacterized protein LOC101495497 n=1 Tax=Cicer arietinum TaxID=3827 RepID=A0A1S2XI61_CICAR|nr:uncharacterized protein LOC101495497 [Cicer arietinum]
MRNPSTEEIKFIPPSLIEFIPYHNVRPIIYGFGHDNVMDDYKVIRHVVFDELTYMDCEDLDLDSNDVPWDDISYEPLSAIYSLRSNSWRKIKIDVSLKYPYPIVQFYNDGMCNWWYASDMYLPETCLMSFDMSNEVLFKTLVPLDKDYNIDLNWV